MKTSTNPANPGHDRTTDGTNERKKPANPAFTYHDPLSIGFMAKFFVFESYQVCDQLAIEMYELAGIIQPFKPSQGSACRGLMNICAILPIKSDYFSASSMARNAIHNPGLRLIYKVERSLLDDICPPSSPVYTHHSVSDSRNDMKNRSINDP